MANLFSSPEHKANIGYNGFDMSKLVTFSSTTGELRPIYFDVLQPGDKVRMTSELRTRTMPLVTPVMCEIKERIEWFFVPFDQMYHRFGEWFHGISDNKSALFADDPNSMLPYFSPSGLTNIFRGLLDSTYTFNDRFAFKGTYLRLMEDIGIPISWIDSLHLNPSQGNLTWPVALSPFIAGAYQKIYQDFYRITEREAVDTPSFNFDDCYQTPEITSFDRFKKVFGLRYRPRRRDFFTNLYTSPLFGQTQAGGMSSVDLTKTFNQWLISGLDYRTIDSANQTDTTDPTAIRPKYANTPNTMYFSPSAIRTSFAVDKLLAITQRSAKRVDKQQLAHFGVNMHDGVGTEVVFIGQSESSIKIGDVISTSDTANGLTGSPLGQLAGKGYGYNKSGNLSYTADRAGVLMAIYSAEPLFDYPSYGLDKLNTLINPSDFPRPEFDNLGMQPLFGSQIYLTPNDGDGESLGGNSSIMGWQYRWSEWKTKYNVVTGALRLGRTMDKWKVQFSRDFTQSGPLLSYFYVSPSELDICVAANYNFSLTDSDQMRFSTDPLIHECYFDVKKSSKMSTYGLEQL